MFRDYKRLNSATINSFDETSHTFQAIGNNFWSIFLKISTQKSIKIPLILKNIPNISPNVTVKLIEKKLIRKLFVDLFSVLTYFFESSIKASAVSSPKVTDYLQ
jgi:hypothetical protein